MAPHKTARNKKNQQHVPVPSKEDGAKPGGGASQQTVSQPSETYEQAQEDEREVLKAIYMDDYEESEAKGAWSVSFP